MRISVIGTGYVGLVSGVCFAEIGHDCICVDVDAAKVARINAALREKNSYHVVVVKSTVVPGTTDKVVLPILEEASGKRAGADFGVGMNPEFLTEGVAIDDFMKPDRIVIGGNDERAIAVQREVYASFAGVPVMVTNNSTAEMIKYTSNSVLATMISFSNEIGNVCAALGDIDVADVMRGVHLARYFNIKLEDGRRLKAPITSFLWAGCGYGGSCLPKDTKALSAHGAAHGRSMPLLDAVIHTNLGQPAELIKIVEKHFRELRGLRVAVLGLAFKEDTDDMRESVAIPVVSMLHARGAQIIAFDPISNSVATRLLPGDIQFAESLETAIAHVDVAVLLTRWQGFECLPTLLSAMQSPPLLVDGRRFLNPAEIPRYDGIGR